MSTKLSLRLSLAAATLLGALVITPAATTAQESGADMWARACNRCHRMQPPTKYDARHWEAIMGHMALNARLTHAEEVAIRDFLVAAARAARPTQSENQAKVARGDGDAEPEAPTPEQAEALLKFLLTLGPPHP